MTLCGLNAVRMLSPDSYDLVADEVAAREFVCYEPFEDEFIDWVKMEAHGLIQTTPCDSEEPFTDLQTVLRANACGTEDGPVRVNTDGVFSLTKKHLELDGIQCAESDWLIGGHCVSCGTICDECDLFNDDGLVYGFYMGEEPINGECYACQPNSQFNYVENKCVCDEGFFYETGASQCSQCSEDCAECESFDVCIECYEFYVIELGEEDSGAYCVPDSCQDGKYFDLTAKKCVDCH